MNPRRQPWQGCTLPLSYSRSTKRDFTPESPFRQALFYFLQRILQIAFIDDAGGLALGALNGMGLHETDLRGHSEEVLNLALQFGLDFLELADLVMENRLVHFDLDFHGIEGALALNHQLVVGRQAVRLQDEVLDLLRDCLLYTSDAADD